jgi:parvulin-like peptidyl-prolyl isomerase
LTEEQIKLLREQWAKVLLTARKAKAIGFDKERVVQLVVEIQEAYFLSEEYTKRNEELLAVSDEELKEYIALHPEFDIAKKRALAEAVLRRAKAGEDFAALAREFSEDPVNREDGGLYEDIQRGQLLLEFEKAVLALKKGQISEIVESPHGYHIIKLERKGRKKNEEGKKEEIYSFRHILIGTAPPNRENSFAWRAGNVTDAAREEIKKAKEDRWVEQLAAKQQVSMPEASEIKIEVPELTPPPTPMPDLQVTPRPGLTPEVEGGGSPSN